MKALLLTLCMFGDFSEEKFVAATNLYNVTWTWYREKRVASSMVYYHSLHLMRAEIDLKRKVVEAHRAHLGRMLMMQDLVFQLRALGRKNQLEIAELQFYIAEARGWIQKDTAVSRRRMQP
jgi:hypothetical protein